MAKRRSHSGGGGSAFTLNEATAGVSLLGGLLRRAGAVPSAGAARVPKMPEKARVAAPKRVQEAMKVVEDWVEGRDAIARGE